MHGTTVVEVSSLDAIRAPLWGSNTLARRDGRVRLLLKRRSQTSLSWARFMTGRKHTGPHVKLQIQWGSILGDESPHGIEGRGADCRVVMGLGSACAARSGGPSLLVCGLVRR